MPASLPLSPMTVDGLRAWSSPVDEANFEAEGLRLTTDLSEQHHAVPER
jgi:hypothetical protein